MEGRAYIFTVTVIGPGFALLPVLLQTLMMRNGPITGTNVEPVTPPWKISLWL